MNIRRPLVSVFVLCSIPLLGGCTFSDEPVYLEESISDTEPETTALTLPTDFTLPAVSRTTAEDFRFTAPMTLHTDTTAAPAAETTVSSAETTAAEQTVTADSTDSTEAERTTVTTVTLPHGELRYHLSGLAAARFVIAENPLQYCNSEDGVTVFDLQRAAEAAGLRKQGEGFGSGGASLQAGALLDPNVHLGRRTDAPVLQEIRYTAGEREIVIDQQAPFKADYALPDGTRITKDQIMLFAFLAEQLAAHPETDPLADVIPARFSGTENGILYYYIP